MSSSSSSSSSRAAASISNNTCAPAFPIIARSSATAIGTRGRLAFSRAPSTAVMTSPGRRSTPTATSGDSSAFNTPEPSNAREISIPPRSTLGTSTPPRHADGRPAFAPAPADPYPRDPPGRRSRNSSSSRMEMKTWSTESSPNACVKTSRKSLLGSFHTSERRGGVERRQTEFKGVTVGD
eukprot:31543-Pelagococcus_subviridis.AAC.6